MRDRPVDSRVSADGCDGRPHVLQVPHFDGSVVAAGHHVVSHCEDGGGHGAAEDSRRLAGSNAELTLPSDASD